MFPTDYNVITFENFILFFCMTVYITKLQVKKETLLDHEDLKLLQNHSSQMAALDFIVSVASSVFIPTYDGNMAKMVEGHRRYRMHQYSRSNIFIFNN